MDWAPIVSPLTEFRVSVFPLSMVQVPPVRMDMEPPLEFRVVFTPIVMLTPEAELLDNWIDLACAALWLLADAIV